MNSSTALVLQKQSEIQPSVISTLSGLTVPDENIVIQLAARLVDHWSGRIAGGYRRVTKAEIEAAAENGYPKTWRRTLDRDGGEILVKPAANKSETGEILFNDAIHVIEEYLPLAINPLAHVSLWYQHSKNGTITLISHLDYGIVIGHANDLADFSTEIVEMTPDERTLHGLNQADLGLVAYMILNEDKREWRQAVLDLIKSGMTVGEAKRLTLEMFSKAAGVGILRAGETKNRDAPKGRSWRWVCEKRAISDMAKRGVGEMTPLQIAQKMRDQGQGLQPGDLAALLDSGYPADAPPDVQQQYVEMHRRAEQIKNNPNPDWQANVDLMRGGDPDPLDLSPDDLAGDPPAPPKPEPAPPKPKRKNGGQVASDTATQFWLLAGQAGISKKNGQAIIGEHGGDIDAAFEALKKMPMAERQAIQAAMTTDQDPNWNRSTDAAYNG